MGVNAGFIAVWIWLFTGWLALWLACALVEPVKRLPNSLFGISILCGISGIIYGVLTFLTGRPIFSVGLILAFMLLLILVSNAKYKSLREPFLYHDYDYFLDALRFPRLFLPFLGIKSFCCAVGAFLIAFLGFWAESIPDNRWSWTGKAGALFWELALSTLLLLYGAKKLPALKGEPEADIENIGFPAFLWGYGTKLRLLPQAHSPFEIMICEHGSKLPQLIAIQSESFFDPRSLFNGINPQVFLKFDKISGESFLHGLAQCPAWGANTVRSEFAFLCGLSEEELGFHRFNPYKAILRGRKPAALPLCLQKMGYRTICIHPYSSAFYGRKKVFSQLGFQQFIDVRQFSKNDRQGLYIGDAAVGRMIRKLITRNSPPTFIFAITMENHGPLHLERPLTQEEKEILFWEEAPAECGDLLPYVRSLEHAVEMVAEVADACQGAIDASICFYGDHVPIMPNCYKVLGEPRGETPYFCWSSDRSKREEKSLDMPLHELAIAWLKGMDLIRECPSIKN